MADKDIQEGAEVTKTFEDLQEYEIKMMTAITRDPNPIHFDREVVEKMGLPGLVNQGASNLSYLIQGIAEFVDSPKQITNVDVRFENQVFEGDTLTTRAVIESVQSEPDTQYVEVGADVAKSDGTVVVTGTAKLELTTD